MTGRGPEVKLALTVEEAGHRAVVEYLVDRPREQRRDGEHGQLVELLLLRHRQRVGDDYLADPRVLQDVDGRPGEDAVRRGDDDPLRALLEQRVRRLGDRPAGV